MSIQPYIASARVRAGSVVGRSAAEFAALVELLRTNPNEWFVYSVHLNMVAAHNRAHQLRGTGFPNALIEGAGYIDFRARRHAACGPAVLVCWVAPS